MKAYIVERDALIHNIQTIRRHAGSVPIWAVLKGNGYGIGLVPFSKLLHENGIDRFAVTERKEAEGLRELFPDAPILMLRSTSDPTEIRELLELGVILTVGSYDTAVAINGVAAELERKAPVHLAVDTGMGRYGFLPGEYERVVSVYEYMSNLTIEGIYTHFHSAFSSAAATTRQFNQLSALINRLRDSGHNPGMVHCCNSHAFLRHPEMHLDAVRIGSAFLGRLSFDDKLGLKKIGRAECTVEALRQIPKGQTVGYGAAFTAKRPMKIGIIGLGWYHGFALRRENDVFRFRDSLAGVLHYVKNMILPPKILVTVEGKKCRVLGHVGMVNAVIDLSDLDCAVGSPVIADLNPLNMKGLRVVYR
ncbi:MAG: alanine racemase [Oscillospiraceae bacterium]|nr:alanine racemase [Oscillospiraceae bacterium]